MAEYDPLGQTSLANSNPIARWWTGSPSAAEHNEAVAAFQREADFNAAESQKNRTWEKMMSDTAIQRRVKDLQAAGFSPLAALGDAQAASTPSGNSASAHASPAKAQDTFTPLVKGVIGIISAAVGSAIHASTAAQGFKEMQSLKNAAQAERDINHAKTAKEMQNARASAAVELQKMKDEAALDREAFRATERAILASQRDKAGEDIVRFNKDGEVVSVTKKQKRAAFEHYK